MCVLFMGVWRGSRKRWEEVGGKSGVVLGEMSCHFGRLFGDDGRLRASGRLRATPQPIRCAVYLESKVPEAKGLRTMSRKEV